MNAVIVAAQLRRKLAASPTLLKTKRTIWAMGRRSDARIIQSFPVFTPNSSGSLRGRAALTIQAANQSFPLMLDLLERTGHPERPVVPIAAFANTAEKRDSASQLSALYDHYGSDKSSPHNYHLLYGPILTDREKVTNLLEVGLGTNRPSVVSHMGRDGKPGASLRAFHDFLPYAQIYGADVDRRILFNDDRIQTFHVDQTELTSFREMDQALGTTSFDLIIDDGLHSPSANLAVLLFGLHRLKVGGWLVIEDIAKDALPVWSLVAALLPASFKSQTIAAKKAYLFAVQRTDHLPGGCS